MGLLWTWQWGNRGWRCLAGGVGCDWLEREWLRGLRGDEGSSIKFPSTNYPLITMFASDLSNWTPTSLFPRVMGNHPRAVFTLDNAVGTITQTDNRMFECCFNGNGLYPSNQRVRDLWNGEYCHRLIEHIDC